MLFNALDSALDLHKQLQSSDVHSSPIALAEREETVLRGVVAGLSNREIAEQLQLSERTVKNSRANLMRQFSANSVADLLVRAAPLWIQGGNVMDSQGSG
ncbi:LuxR C-terminal-related transcriptional regulator [Paraburkholderia acidiphila]|uniref:HTH luxR-type domain-containing protein n=1 Tax=Paraburkholderia acidiphila TaxID=2571747 RepID=A0A7Z2JBP7_9BURK|nr:helix-turn-helix transcriptional regulator [Paraburkholderia acidiphila]QGZ57729.1 hypothetical protein FAZ97_22840 [Paraburkholderia acidiphila]